jgi:hypothetical protein
MAQPRPEESPATHSTVTERPEVQHLLASGRNKKVLSLEEIDAQLPGDLEVNELDEVFSALFDAGVMIDDSGSEGGQRDPEGELSPSPGDLTEQTLLHRIEVGNRAILQDLLGCKATLVENGVSGSIRCPLQVV